MDADAVAMVGRLLEHETQAERLLVNLVAFSNSKTFSDPAPPAEVATLLRQRRGYGILKAAEGFDWQDTAHVWLTYRQALLKDPRAVLAA
jgi:hypothetical protein